MTDFSLTFQWLNGDLDFPEETASFAEISVSVGGTDIGSAFDPETGTTVGGVRLPASVLASGLADQWWSLLYETQKGDWDLAFEARHRLDALTRGYVFPPLAIWSSGESVAAELLAPDKRFQSQIFADTDKRGPWSLARTSVEEALGSFVSATIAQISRRNADASFLRDAWKKVEDSAMDPDERNWRINAGRLGIDPYDPEGPDLNRMAEGLSDTLFGDICEASAADRAYRHAGGQIAPSQG